MLDAKDAREYARLCLYWPLLGLDIFIRRNEADAYALLELPFHLRETPPAFPLLAAEIEAELEHEIFLQAKQGGKAALIIVNLLTLSEKKPFAFSVTKFSRRTVLRYAAWTLRLVRRLGYRAAAEPFAENSSNGFSIAVAWDFPKEGNADD